LKLKGVTGFQGNFPIQPKDKLYYIAKQFFKTTKLFVEGGSYLASQ